MDKLNFNLICPNQAVFSGPVDMVVVPGSEGDFGVLYGHAPLMSTMRSSVITVYDGKTRQRSFVYGGFAEVNAKGLTILAEDVIALNDVNKDQVNRDLLKAREELQTCSDPMSKRQAEGLVDKLSALIEALP